VSGAKLHWGTEELKLFFHSWISSTFWLIIGLCEHCARGMDGKAEAALVALSIENPQAWKSEAA